MAGGACRPDLPLRLRTAGGKGQQADFRKWGTRVCTETKGHPDYKELRVRGLLGVQESLPSGSDGLSMLEAHESYVGA